jgi:trypsin-like peptidase
VQKLPGAADHHQLSRVVDRQRAAGQSKNLGQVESFKQHCVILRGIGRWQPVRPRWYLTAGIVSPIGRDIGNGPYDDFIQIDAPVNKGKSGGPSFNTEREVIGVTTAIYSPSGGNVGIAFSIPAFT